MLKRILELNGAQPLSTDAQKDINGGGLGLACGDGCLTSGCLSTEECIQIFCGSQPPGWVCVNLTNHK